MLFLLRLSVEQGWPGVFNLPVDQASHRTHTRCMFLTMMTIHLSQTLVTPQPADAVFHHDAPLGKGRVVGGVFRWSLTPARLAPRCGSQALRVQHPQTQIGQVAQCSHTRRQTLQQTRRFEQLQVGGGAGHARRNIHNAAAPLLHSNLTFERVLFFLPL